MEEAVIKVESVTKTYGSQDSMVKALNAIDLTIKQGEFTAIVGPSGSGKSTLLNIVSGLDTPTSGDVYLSGKLVGKMRSGELSDFRRDHIGFVFQSYNLIPVLSAAENVEYILLLQGIKEKERKERVYEILKEVGLEGLADRRPSQLSGGQQQRVAVARAIVSNPDIVLADEPTANLDSATGTSLLEIMKELNQKKNITFVFSTHDPKIMDRAKRLVVLMDGKVDKDEVH